MNISEGDLIAAIQQAWEEHTAPDEDTKALTRRELQAATGWSRNRAHAAIRHLVESGEWEHVRVRRRLIDGRVRAESAYRPVVGKNGAA